MADAGCEIEYLDEDEDVIQQYVLTEQKPEEKPAQKIEESTTDCEDSDELNATIASLIRKQETETKKKAIKYDTDSDYDPTDDINHEETDELKSKKLGDIKLKPAKPALKLGMPIKDMRLQQVEQVLSKKTVEYKERKHFKIRMPDFEDPLCLPVRGATKEDDDVKKLNIWNRACLDQYIKHHERQSNTNFRSVRSCKTVIFRNTRHLGKTETVAYFRSHSQNKAGVKRSETSQGMMPKIKEKRGLRHTFDTVKDVPRLFKSRSEVILSKEKLDNDDVLVIYKPGDSTSTVMKMVEEKRGDDNPPRKVIEEIALTRMCTPCYQMSYRGYNKDKKSVLNCNICTRTFTGVYSLLTHLKTYHKDEQVHKFKGDLSRAVAEAVNYHYKCRVCSLNCTSIMQLRKHVVTHKGDEVFKCEVGNHMVLNKSR